MSNPLAAPHEFEVGGHPYRCRRLDAMTQWHIVRRLSPLAASMTSLAASMKSEEPKEGEDAPALKSLSDALLEAIRRPGAGNALEVAAKTLADMKDEDSDYILHACMKVCERKANNGAGWLAVWNAQANTSSFDIDLGQMLKMCMEVLKDSLGGFFPELLSALSAEPPA